MIEKNLQDKYFNLEKITCVYEKHYSINLTTCTKNCGGSCVSAVSYGYLTFCNNSLEKPYEVTK